MRYIEITQLKEGMVLAQHFYGDKFEILLAKNTTLTGHQIQRIQELGYAGVYILDAMSADIAVHDIIPDELRLQAIKFAREVWQHAKSGQLKKGNKMPRELQRRVVMPVIDSLIGNRYRLVDKIDLKPYRDYTYYHAANVMVLSLLTGLEMGLSGDQLYELGITSLLYDVGNAFLPPVILQKPGKLNPVEYELVRKHTETGFQCLRDNFDIAIDACMGALQHHEHYDGSGYPNGLKKNKISLSARIIAIADVFDALTSRRPFRDPMFPPQAIEHIQSKAGSTFDPEIFEAFKKIVALYPSGLCVELSTGVRCIVVNNYRGDPERPRLRLLGNISSTPLYVDLHEDSTYANTYITGIVPLA